MASFSRLVGRQTTVVLFLSASLCVSLARAQSDGQIRLQVTDALGAVTKATGTIRNPAAHTSKAFETDPQGAHTFSGLPYGDYEIQVVKPGFAAKTVHIEVRSATPVKETVSSR